MGMRRLVIDTLAWFGGITVAWIAAVWIWVALGRRRRGAEER
jgi:hypothetical protein